MHFYNAQELLQQSLAGFAQALANPAVQSAPVAHHSHIAPSASATV